MTALDIDALRAETPGVSHVLHLNNAGCSLPPLEVDAAVDAHLALERRIGGYEAVDAAADRIDDFYAALAALIGAAGPDEIAYVENATRAWDMVAYGFDWRPGDRVLTHASEYVSNMLAFLELKRRFQIEIDVCPSDSSGQIDLDALPGAITPRTRMIALTHIPTQGGLINPAFEVGRIARAHGVFYLLDACQSAGQLALDVAEIGCDAMSGTGRKFLRGPRGTGFLYVRRGSLDQLTPPLIDLTAAVWTSPETYEWAPGARRFECFESFVAGKIGLGVAARYAARLGMIRIESRLRRLADELREQLADIPFVTLRDLGREKGGIVTFESARETPEALKLRLRAEGVNVSVSRASSSRLDLPARGVSAVVRASTHYFNTEDEIARAVALIADPAS